MKFQEVDMPEEPVITLTEFKEVVENVHSVLGRLTNLAGWRCG
jgi:hypothetical protein